MKNNQLFVIINRWLILIRLSHLLDDMDRSEWILNNYKQNSLAVKVIKPFLS